MKKLEAHYKTQTFSIDFKINLYVDKSKHFYDFSILVLQILIILDNYKFYSKGTGTALYGRKLYSALVERPPSEQKVTSSILKPGTMRNGDLA